MEFDPFESESYTNLPPLSSKFWNTKKLPQPKKKKEEEESKNQEKKSIYKDGKHH